MHKAFGPLVLTLRYAYAAPWGTIWFQQVIPVNLRDRYGGSKRIRESLHTRDVAKAARMVPGKVAVALE